MKDSTLLSMARSNAFLLNVFKNIFRLLPWWCYFEWL